MNYKLKNYTLFYIKIVEKNINLWYTNLDYYININIYKRWFT